MKGLIWFFIFMRRPSPRSTMVGKLSRRSVWPVGAVSNTTTEKFIPFTNLFQQVIKDTKLNKTSPTTSFYISNFYLCIYFSPHDLCVAHSLVNARESTHGFLHHFLAHAEHVVLLKEFIRQFGDAQARVNLLFKTNMKDEKKYTSGLLFPALEILTSGELMQKAFQKQDK